MWVSPYLETHSIVNLYIKHSQIITPNNKKKTCIHWWNRAWTRKEGFYIVPICDSILSTKNIANNKYTLTLLLKILRRTRLKKTPVPKTKWSSTISRILRKYLMSRSEGKSSNSSTSHHHRWQWKELKIDLCCMEMKTYCNIWKIKIAERTWAMQRIDTPLTGTIGKYSLKTLGKCLLTQIRTRETNILSRRCKWVTIAISKWSIKKGKEQLVNWYLRKRKAIDEPYFRTLRTNPLTILRVSKIKINLGYAWWIERRNYQH